MKYQHTVVSLNRMPKYYKVLVLPHWRDSNLILLCKAECMWHRNYLGVSDVEHQSVVIVISNILGCPTFWNPYMTLLIITTVKSAFFFFRESSECFQSGFRIWSLHSCFICLTEWEHVQRQREIYRVLWRRGGHNHLSPATHKVGSLPPAQPETRTKLVPKWLAD